MTFRNISTIAIGIVFFTVLSGFRGCTPGEVAAGAFVAGAVIATAADHDDGYVYVDSPAVYAGDIALTVYAPITTHSFHVIVRDGSAFGPVVLDARDFPVDAHGVGYIDIGGLAYGYYDIEIIGLDQFGYTASHTSLGFVVDTPYASASADLRPIHW